VRCVLAAAYNAAMDLLDAPLATSEFLVVDTETNGKAGEACELTEVGAVLVGGGELHDRWESLVGVRAPLSRGIQRFTGITQAMVDEAPAAELVLPELAEQLDGRVLVGHNVAFDRRVLRRAFERASLDWPDPPAVCTVALARRFAPLARQRRLAALAGSLGVEVEVTHRALADAETCARVFCALFGRLCANAMTVRDALEALRPSRRRTQRPKVARPAVLDRPDFGELPDTPGVYVFRNAEGQPLYVGKSVHVRTRARSHFAPSAEGGDWKAQAAIVDHRATRSELGALLLESRLIKALRPPGNVRLKHQDRYVYLRCRFDIPFPVLEVAPEPAAGHAVNVGPLRGRASAVELKEQLDSLFGLRHCPRTLRRRYHPSVYGQMGRCLSPCLGDLDPNLYRRRLDEALALFTGAGDGGAALLAHVDAQMRAAADERRFERAAWLRRRHGRLRVLLERLGPVLRAAHSHPRLVVAEGPEGADAFWLVGGRVVDWGPLGADVAERTAAALRVRAEPYVPADEVHEARLVETWIATHEPRVVGLAPPPPAAALHALAPAAA
jgi:DNA polymerase III subunit epsilon